MDLLQRFTHGEIDAFETLVGQFQGDIYAWTVRIVRDPGVAEDLTVETLWRVYRSRQKFRPDGNSEPGHGGSLLTWRSTISGNRPEQSFLTKPAEAARPDPLVERETRERIQQAFRRLPAKLQVAATLALVEEQPYDEIASALGTSVGAVKLRVFRAVRILRKRLNQAGIRPE